VTGGLLDLISDPEAMAQAVERARIVEKLSKQMGVSKEEARNELWRFEACTSSEGHTVH
jgi:Mn-dependent DtxR family transcriptional regulator